MRTSYSAIRAKARFCSPSRIDSLGFLRVTFPLGTLSSSRCLRAGLEEGATRGHPRKAPVPPSPCTGALRGWNARRGGTLKARVLQEESPALAPIGLKNLVLCQVKPSKRLTSVVSKPACFPVTHFKPRFNLSQGTERLPSPLTPGTPPGGKGSGVGANLGTGLQSRKKGNSVLSSIL